MSPSARLGAQPIRFHRCGARFPSSTCRRICKFPASWENIGNFAHFACWEQSNGAECLNKNNHLRENSPAPSNREISGLIRELNWEISHRSGRGLLLGLVGSYVKEDELCGS